MWQYYFYDELYHHGVKGMKWGRRRYQNKDGSLTLAGKKREYKQAKREYKQAKREHWKEKPVTQKVITGISKASVNVGKAYLYDYFLFGGRGTRAVKTIGKYAGRAAVTAFVKARGGYDIRWYDN